MYTVQTTDDRAIVQSENLHFYIYNIVLPNSETMFFPSTFT